MRYHVESTPCYTRSFRSRIPRDSHEVISTSFIRGYFDLVFNEIITTWFRPRLSTRYLRCEFEIVYITAFHSLDQNRQSLVTFCYSYNSYILKKKISLNSRWASRFDLESTLLFPLGRRSQFTTKANVELCIQILIQGV